METAHNPAHTVDNQVGYGVVDPVAALTYDVAPGDPKPLERLTTNLYVPPPPPGPDTRPRTVALLGAAGAVVVAVILGGIAMIRRRMS
jgi:membrane-anchored mycosin MYCP